MQKRNLLFLVLGLLSACASQVEHVEVKQAIQLTDPTRVKPIAITKVAATIRRGTVVGEVGTGWVCMKADDIKWRSGNKVSLSSEDLVDVFREELEVNGWPVVGSTEDLFEGYDVSGAEILVAARVIDLETKMCAPNAGFGNWNLNGSMRMTVEWQVYSPARRSLVGKIETQGSAELKKSDADAPYLLLNDAFAVAANNLIASEEFLSLTERSSGLATSPRSAELRTIPNRQQSYQTMEAAIAAAKKGTVTVRTASGHGSGFTIGDGSYVLTNAHVVGDAKVVTLVTNGDIAIDARVEYVSKERDAALIRIESLRLPPIHVNPTVPGSGSKVYAIGSPLLQEMSGSVTSGIVSGTRMLDGYEWLQCDVAISPGNSGGPLLDSHGSVIGISTAGFQAGGSQVGLNLFIPIDQALAFAGLIVDEPTIAALD